MLRLLTLAIVSFAVVTFTPNCSKGGIAFFNGG